MHPFKYQSVDNVTLTANFRRIKKNSNGWRINAFTIILLIQERKDSTISSVKHKLILYVQDKNEVCEQ